MNKYKLSDLCISITDGEHGSIKDSPNSNFYLLNNNNITQSGIKINANDRHISEADFKKIHKRTNLQKGDLVIATCGTLGKTVIINDNIINYEFSRSVGIIKCDLNKLIPNYLHYYFQSPSTQYRIKNIAKGGVQKHFYINDMADFEIYLPDLPTQKKIADVLSCIDDKIALNNKTNTELENMAKTIYDYWFTQFDFPDKNGHPYKTSGGQMVYNETLKREIPTGWEVKSLIEIESNIVTGKTPSTKDETNFYGDIPFITIDDIRNQLFVCSTERTLSEKGANLQKTKYLPEGSLCCSCIGTAGVIGFVGKKGQTNQQINSIVFSNETNKEFLYFGLNNYFENASGKSGNIFTNMNKDEFGAIQFIYPGKELISKYHQNVFSIFQKIKENIQENQQLIKLRDYLLPLLMNGQIEVK